MMLRPLLMVLALVVSGCPHYPYGESSAPVLDVSPDGRYLLAVTNAGEIRVWGLREKKLLLLLPPGGQSSGAPVLPRYSGAALRGGTGSLLYECVVGVLCSRDLVSGEEERLFAYDPQDEMRLGLASPDGKRIALGTAGGSVLTYEAESGSVRVRKPKDVWSPGSSIPVYTLEGDRDLEVVFSATAQITMAFADMTEGDRPAPSPEGGFVQFAGRRAPMWRGIVAWPFEGTGYRLVDQGLSDKVRIDISPKEDRVAIFQEGGSRWVLRYPSLEPEADLSLPSTPEVAGTDGVRFLNAEGTWLGRVNHADRRIALYSSLGDGRWSYRGALRLRHLPAGGSRMMVALPEKRWFFIGLRDAAVDWYEFVPGDRPSIKHVATLR